MAQREDTAESRSREQDVWEMMEFFLNLFSWSPYEQSSAVGVQFLSRDTKSSHFNILSAVVVKLHIPHKRGEQQF